jgi:hypothetical protein
MSAAELKLGWERIFTITEYYDGPRQGVANFKGQPHFYDCIFDEGRSNYSDLYRLTPLAPHILDLAREDWAIWERWESAFNAGNTTRETHPALPEDRVRYEEIRVALDPVLRTDNATCVIQAASFEEGIGCPLQVRWTNPKKDEG